MLRKITVRFIGTSPLLMSNGGAMLDDQTGATTKGKKQRNPAYFRDKKENLYFLPCAFRASLIKRCTNQKMGKVALKGVVTGALFDTADTCPLTNGSGKALTEYEIDSRRHRPRLEQWQCEAAYEVDDDWLVDVDFLIDVWEQAGKTIGVGACRPERMGSFGRYRVELVDCEDSEVWERSREEVKKATKAKKAK